MKPRQTTTQIKPRLLERVTNPPAEIDPALWQRGCELWATIRWQPLDSEFAIKVLLPLIQATDRVRELEMRLAKLESAA